MLIAWGKKKKQPETIFFNYIFFSMEKKVCNFPITDCICFVFMFLLWVFLINTSNIWGFFKQSVIYFGMLGML